METMQGWNKHGVQGKAESFWIDSTKMTEFPSLPSDILVDVAIIGGGFVGIAAGYLLKQAGLKVATIEARRVVQGVTGYTTAKLTSLHRLIYKHLLDTFGNEQAKQYAEVNQTAIDKIETLARELHTDCDFARLPFYSFAESDKYAKKVEEEVNAAQSLGLPAAYIQNIPLPLQTRGAIRFENQAQFHPRKFLLPLAQTIPGKGSFLFEQTRAVDITDKEPCTINTDKGKFRANNVIIATNFPIQDKDGVYFARMKPKRSYVLGVRVGEPFPEGMFINAEEDTGHSFRTQPTQNGQILIIGGEDHITGHEPNTVQRYQRMAEFVNEIYTNPQIEYSWSTQDNITVDKVPYIGKLTPGSKHIFVATGFGQWGMTTSMAAAMILTDLVQGRPNPWAEVFNPSRLKPDISAAKKLVSINMKVIKKLTGGKISGKEDISKIFPGEGKIAEFEKQRAAVYRDEHDQLYVLSSSCTHMGCTVTWNNAEKTWDCPCHGSRYDSGGEVIHSPAVKGLIPLKGTVQDAKQLGGKIASTADLSPGKMVGIDSQGRKILLANLDGNYYAIGNVCSHQGCTLSEGQLKGETVQCPCHGSVFNIKTGEVVQGPAKKPEPTYRLEVDSGQIFLLI
jgi:glycine/D-amino acid oxidase-like deaminating enzyme/nitrite reductase/ring-hydroxylating ferredoxin subunit